jgi:flagellar hook-basal body complex protein FliE
MEINNVLSQMRALTSSMDLPTAGPKAADNSFGQVLQQSINKVNEQQSVATSMMTDFQNGNPETSVAEVMVSMQKASLSFSAMTQVRNKLVDAYQEIMNMPI